MTLPKLDPTITVQQLTECAEQFLAAGLAYWEMQNKIRKMGGAISWVKDTDGALAIFTRGEYSQQLVNNIERQGPVFHFGTGDLDEFR